MLIRLAFATFVVLGSCGIAHGLGSRALAFKPLVAADALARQVHRRGSIQVGVKANIDLSKLDLKGAGDIIDSIVKKVDDVAGKVGTVADSVIKDDLEPLLNDLVSSVTDLLQPTETVARGRLARRSPDFNEVKNDLQYLLLGIADVLNQVEGIAKNVPVVGDLLDEVFAQLNPILSRLLTAVDDLLAGVKDAVNELLSPTLEILLPCTSKLLSGVLDSALGLVSGLVGAL